MAKVNVGPGEVIVGPGASAVSYDPKRHTVLVLTKAEANVLSEALRFSQENYSENRSEGYDDPKEYLDPTLSRIQRKLGEEPHT